jgi:hypothetical protein
MILLAWNALESMQNAFLDDQGNLHLIDNTLVSTPSRVVAQHYDKHLAF